MYIYHISFSNANSACTIAVMATKEKSKLSQRLQKYRKMAGFQSPEQLAEAINNPAVTKSTIINLEQGRKSDMTVTELLILAKAFGVSAIALVCDIDDPFGHPDISGFERYHNADLADLLSLYDGTYGPQIDTSTNMSLRPTSATNDKLHAIYFYMNYLATGLDSFAEASMSLEKAKLSHDAQLITTSSRSMKMAKKVIGIAVEQLPKECGITIPEDILSYANNILETPVDDEQDA